MFRQFKEFAFKGNMIDMAVGLIIGAGFTTVVKSLVDDIAMPLLGILSGRLDFGQRFIALDGGDYHTLKEAEILGAPVLKYGAFINNLISFVLVSLAVYILVQKVIGALRKREAAAPELTTQEKLLTEIRDLLAKQGDPQHRA